MSSKARVNVAVLLLAAYAALGLMSLLGVPEPLAGLFESDRTTFWLQGLAGITAVILLWSVAWKTLEQHAIAREALRLATERADELQKRVEEAEAKLVRALDEGIMNWAPAYERLREESEQRFRRQFSEYNNELLETYNSFRRRAERGYLQGDDTSKPPPNE